MKLGFVGVDFFFVISGFLISYQLFRLNDSVSEGRIKPLVSIKHFLIRRGLRIFPAYYLVVILATIFNKGEIRDAFLYNISYTSNFYFIHVQNWSSTFSPFWSLSVEEHFYLFWPIALLLLRKRFIPFLILGIVLFSVAFRYFSFVSTGDYFTVYIHTLSCLDLFMYGGALAYYLYTSRQHFLNFFSKPPVKFAILIGIALCYLSVVVFDESNLYAWVFFRIIFGLLCAGLLALLVVGFKGLAKRVFEHKWLVYGGKLSYSIYLLHNFVPGILIALKKIGLPIGLEFLIYFIVTVLLSWILHRFVEKPIRRLGERYRIV